MDRETPVSDTAATREWKELDSITGEVLVELERDERSGKFHPSIAFTQVPQKPGLPLPLPRPSFTPSTDSSPFTPSTRPPSHRLHSEPEDVRRFPDSLTTLRKAALSPSPSLPVLAIHPFEFSLDDIPSLREPMSVAASLCPAPLKKAKETEVETKAKETDVSDDEVSSEAGRLFHAD